MESIDRRLSLLGWHLLGVAALTLIWALACPTSTPTSRGMKLEVRESVYLKPDAGAFVTGELMIVSFMAGSFCLFASRPAVEREPFEAMRRRHGATREASDDPVA